MSGPAATVIIPTYNRISLLERSLRALALQTVPPDTFEVIVVDDGSTDGTGAMFEAASLPYPIMYLAQQRSGVATARNAGLARARGAIVCFLDDDVIADPGLIEAYLAAHDRFPDSAFVGTLKVVDDAGTRALGPLATLLRGRQSQMDRELTPFDLLSGNCSLRRDTLLALGGFDPALPSAEDFELGLRLEEQGVTLRHCALASATEHFQRGVDVFVDGAFRTGWAHALIVRKHPRAARLLRLERPFEASMVKRGALRLAWHASSLLRPPARPTGPRRWPGPAWLWRRVGSLFYWAGVRRGIDSLEQLQRLAHPELIILGYHVVDEVNRPAAPAYRVTPDRFAEHVDYLKSQGYTTITVAEWIRALAGRASLPARPLIITFDDGDRRTIPAVLPVLSAAGFRATLFVVSSAVGGTNRWDEAAGLPRRTVASQQELRALVASGWEIGSHSRTHRSLPTLPAEDLRDEIAGSRTELEARIASDVTTFAYPYGNYDREVAGALREAGYEAACCSDTGVNGPETDRYRLRRIFVSQQDDVAAFAAKLRDARSLGRSATAERIRQRVSDRMRRPA